MTTLSTAGGHIIKVRRYWLGALLGVVVMSGMGGIVPVSQARPSIHAQTDPFVQTHGPVTVRLDLAPAAFGPNRLLVTLYDLHQRPLTGLRVQIMLDMLDMSMGTTTLQAESVGAGRYQALPRLAMPGHWQIRVSVHGPGLPGAGVLATFRLSVAAQARGPVPTALPLVGVAPVATPVPTVAPSAVQWPATLPARAVVSFLDNGMVYIPGHAALIHIGQLNHTVAAAPDGTLWVTDFLGDQVVVLDPQTGQERARIHTGLGPVHVAFTANGERAYVSDYYSADVALVDVKSHRILTRIPVGLWPHGLAITPDGTQVWVPCGGAASLAVIDTHTNRVVHTYIAGLTPHAVAFSPDGRTVYMTDAGQQTLVILDRVRGTVKARVPIGTGSAMVAASPDGQRLYVTGQGGHTLTIVSAASQRVLARVDVGAGPHGLALTPDGHFVYVAVNNARHISVVDTRTARVVATIAVPGLANELVLWP